MEKNLSDLEAYKKFKELIEEINVAMLITKMDGEEHTRPMATMDVDEDANIWFFTSKRSIKVDEVNANHEVHLVYAHPGKDSYLDVKGHADIIFDRDLINNKWQKIVEAWFPEGKDDPDLCLMRVVPYQAHYWDSASNKLVEGIRIVASIFTGKKLADGEEGDIDLK
jgi:general stress protein 26